MTVLSANGAIAKATDTGTTADSLPGTTKSASVGTAVITGGAPDKPSIAKYVDALSRLTVVTNPYLTTATKSNTAGDQAWQFSITVEITSTTLCGRFTSKCATSGGK